MIACNYQFTDQMADHSPSEVSAGDFFEIPRYYYFSLKSNLLIEYTVWYRTNQDYTMTLNELEKGDKKGLLVQLWSFIRWLTVNYHKPPGQLARVRFLNGPDSN